MAEIRLFAAGAFRQSTEPIGHYHFSGEVMPSAHAEM